jgi:hypothetical protein
MDVGNLAYLVHPGARKITRRKLLLLLALVCVPLLTTGCLCLNIGGFGCDHGDPDGVTAQKGELNQGHGGPVTVYYPVPYASPPNLELHDPFHRCKILEQRPDCFVVVMDGPGIPSVDWTARGVRTPAPTSAPPASTVAATPGQTPEPQPVVTTSP